VFIFGHEFDLLIIIKKCLSSTEPNSSNYKVDKHLFIKIKIIFLISFI